MKPQRFGSQRTLSRMFEEAAAAWKRQDYGQTIEMLERAARLRPAHAGTQLDLGRAYGLRYDYEAAERCLERAVRFAPVAVEALAEAGRRCQEFGRADMAGRYFQRAAREQGVSPNVFVALAELEERHARIGEAGHWVDRALAAQPEHPPALLTRARLSRLRGELEEAEAVLRSLQARGSTDPQTRIGSWYELGNVLDRQARYDEAMAAVLEAKALLRPAAASPLAILGGIQARIREIEETLDSVDLQKWADARGIPPPASRLALLCGHPRSGTTLLEQMLGAHPDIVTAEETHVLHDEAYLPLGRGVPPETPVLQMLDAASAGALDRSRAEYFRCTEALVGEPIGDRVLIDKNPALNVLIPAVARLFPEARFLVAVRDPRDVCLSCFMQPLALNPVSSAYLSLDGTVAQYTAVMGLWRTLRPKLKNEWIEVRYEDVVADVESAGRRVLAFLQVPWDREITRFHDHARGRLLRSPSYAEVVQPVSQRAVGRWRNYEKFLKPWEGALAPFIEACGYR